MADNVVRTRRTILQAKLEAVHGTLETSWSAADSLPIYNAFNVFQAEIETIPVNRARSTLDPSEVMVGIANSRFTGDIYVFGNGNATNAYSADGIADPLETALPRWTRLLQSAGFSVELDEATHGFQLGDVLFSPVSEDQPSLSLRTWLDAHEHDSAGARGNIVFNADAGNPVIGSFDFLGSYIKAYVAQQTGMADVSSDPGLPPKFCGTNSFRLKGERQAALITPAVKSFSLDLGVQPTIRRDANVDNCVAEVGIYQEYQTRLSVVIEVRDFNASLGDGTDVRDFIEAMNKGDKFAFELRIGPYTASTARGNQLIFFNFDDITGSPEEPDITNTTDYRAQLSRAPQYSDVDGVRTYDLEFALTGLSDNFLKALLR